VLGNSGNGVVISNNASGNTIGGTTAAARNVISGNNNPATGGGVAGHGVLLASDNNTVLGNFIGTDVTGAQKLGNSVGVGVYGGTGNVIGGLTAMPGTGSGNVISGNLTTGVTLVHGSGTQVLGNLIGTNSTGTAALANGTPGVTESEGIFATQDATN